MSAAVAAVLICRGSPLAARWSLAMASSAKSGEEWCGAAGEFEVVGVMQNSALHP